MHRALIVLGCGLGGFFLLSSVFALRLLWRRRGCLVPALLIVASLLLLLTVLVAASGGQGVR